MFSFLGSSSSSAAFYCDLLACTSVFVALMVLLVCATLDEARTDRYTKISLPLSIVFLALIGSSGACYCKEAMRK